MPLLESDQPLLDGLNEMQRRHPNVTVDLVLAGHERPSDWDTMAGLFPGTDIYCPEVFGWTKDDLLFFEALACSAITPAQLAGDPPQPSDAKPAGSFPYRQALLHHAVRRRQYEIVHGSGARIGMLDAPDGHELEKRLHAPQPPQPVDRRLKTMLLAERARLSAWATLNLERENLMLTTLPSVVNTACSDYPHLTTKEEIRVTLSLGGLHVRIAELLAASQVKTATHTAPDTPVPNHTELAARSYASGQTPSDEAVMRSRVEHLFLYAFGDSVQAHATMHSQRDAAHALVQSLSPSELRGILDVKWTSRAGAWLSKLFAKKRPRSYSSDGISAGRLRTAATKKGIDVDALLRP